VPCAWGTKTPLIPYTERTFESTKAQSYLQNFVAQETNIAAYLGKASGGLCAIDFDADEDLAKFLAINPGLAGTTHSRGSRGGMLWLRIQGGYPESCSPQHKHFEWRADKRLSTIWGRHPNGMDYKLICDAPPVVVPFVEIVWPEWELPWESDTRLRELYGEPFFFNKWGEVTQINETYWAGLFAAENTLLFEPDENDFYRYNPENGLYQTESTDAIRTKLSSRVLDASRQANTFELQRKRTANTLNNVIAHLRGIVERRGAFAEQNHFIHVANGVIVFNRNEADLYPFSCEFCSRNRSPIIFDERATCPRFLEELILPAVHPEDVELIQKYAGMCLLGNNLAQRFLILDGEEGRGKTQLANVVASLVGLENVTQLRTKLLAERFELFRYRKKTLLVGVDVDGDFLNTKGAAVLKGLVGGDWFDAEQKGGTGCFQIQGKFNVIITSNARLRVRLQGDVGAWKRRITIVRYEAPPPKKKIPDFAGLLVRNEGSGILNWALIGAQKLLHEMPAEGGDFVLTTRQAGIVDSLLAESESLRHFLRDRVIKDSSKDVAVAEIVEAYAAYCPERKWQPMPLTEVQHQLEALMLELFGVAKSNDIRRNDKQLRGFHQVTLVGDSETQ
jgi:P4 family phage/plasmid primase-like protien